MCAMAGDFYERQDRSKRSTLLLVFLFALAVVAILFAVYGAVHLLFFKWHLVSPKNMRSAPPAADAGFSWYWFLRVSAVTGSVILGGTLYKIVELSRGGGAAVAKMLGGVQVDPATAKPLERRLMNIVEEMSIASGVPAPSVFILASERGINAFAAGLDRADAVVAVTRGALETLNREELQGVVAHEFSHILNADIRLNMSLIGWLHGITMLSVIGKALMRPTFQSYSSRRRNAGAFVLLGLVLFVIGYIGLFFARLIQAALSRTREMLADASAVQFTRNPAGLAGALKKIGGYEGGAGLETAYAEEAAHMFFGDALTSRWVNLWATHPPLPERIRLLEPGWRGNLETVAGGEALANLDAVEREEGVRGAISHFSTPRAAPCTPSGVARTAGVPTPEQVDLAAQLLQGVDKRLLEAARTPGGAFSLVLALLVQPGTDPSYQLGAIAEKGGTRVGEAVRVLAALLNDAPRQARLALADISLPALKKLDNAKIALLLELMDRLIGADGRLDPFEVAVRAVVGARLKALLGRRAPVKPGNTGPDLSVLLSVLARHGCSEEKAASRAFIAAQLELGPLGSGVAFREEGQADALAFEESAARLAGMNFAGKKLIVKAMVAAASEDGVVTETEGELVRAAAHILDVPLPPFGGC